MQELSQLPIKFNIAVAPFLEVRRAQLDSPLR